MKVAKVLILMMLPVFFTHAALGQKRKIEKANKLYEGGEYFEAIEKYKKVYSKVKKNKKLKAEIAFKTAECYRKLNQAKKSESWYRKAIKGKYPDPKAVLYYANALKKLESYEDAVIEYERYNEMVPDDPAGKLGMESCKLSLKWLGKPSNIKVELVKDISSKSMDYGPVFADQDNKTIFFVSAREGAEGEKFSNASGQNFSDIFTATVDRKGDWSEPVPISGEVNGIFDDGALTFTSDKQTMYFTRCEQKKKESAGCRIYKAKKSGDEWSKVEEVVLVADSSVSLGHPSLSKDDLTLYFASDLKDGKGGKDIWKVTRKSVSDQWGKPENLGDKINTPGNEMFPFIHPDGSLYFSSDFHVGMGGLDIFRYGPDKDGEMVLENMRNPINSPDDDFAICLDETAKKGFFSSTRKASGLKSDNIYSFEIPVLKFSLDGLVVKESDNSPLEGVRVMMTGSDGSSLEAKTKKDGKFKFKLEKETDYVVVTSKDEYFKGKGQETTKGLTESKVLKMKIPMQQIKKEVAFEVENIFYDLDKATLRPESMVSLDKLVELLELNPNLQIELGSHTDFRGSDKYNQKLSQKRAESVVNYLIKNGIKKERLVAKGNGENVPRTIDLKLHKAYPDFPIGTVLNEEYIKGLATDELKEQAHQINRRTDFKVLRTDFEIRAIDFGNKKNKR